MPLDIVNDEFPIIRKRTLNNFKLMANDIKRIKKLS